ncbi:MAG: HEAT repeat domain-containing protein, partial [Polyangiaceae bacterium]
SVTPLLHDPNSDWRRRAALALGERGQASACGELAAWWTEVVASTQKGGADGEPPRLTIDLRTTRELLGATAKAGCRSAVPSILDALDDVRARPFAADALGTLGDERARGPLLGLLASDPYVTTRPHEARALLEIGVDDHLLMSGPAPEVHEDFVSTRPLKIAVLLSDGSARLEASAGGVPALPSAPSGGEGEARIFDAPLDHHASRGTRWQLDLRASVGKILGVWLIPRGPT